MTVINKKPELLRFMGSNGLNGAAAPSVLLGTFITWNAYTGYSAILLASVLFLIGAGILIIGRNMRNPIKLPKMPKVIGIIVIVVWILSILFVLRIARQIPGNNQPGLASLGPIFPITIITALASFLIIAYLSRKSGILAAMRDGFVGLCAGPMVFELPYIFIITPMKNNVSNALAAEAFLALLVVSCTTLALLAYCRRAKVTRLSAYMLGAMFLVFAAWALLAGFSFPSSPVPFALNALSKILGFAAIVAMFMGNRK